MGTYPASNGKPTYLEFLSPIGLFCHMFHDKPQLKTVFNSKTPILDDDGVQVAEYKVTMAWDKALLNTELIPMRQLAYQAQCEAWPETLDPAKASWIVLEPFLRDGDNPQHNTERREYLFGKVYMNFKQRAKPRKTPDNRIIYEGAPGLLGPYGEDIFATDLWAGCTGRVSGVLWGTEYAGKKFITVRLNNIQKYMEGEKMGGGQRKDARQQFDPLMAGSPPGMGLAVPPMGQPGPHNPFGSLGAGLTATPMQTQQPAYGQQAPMGQPQYGQLQAAQPGYGQNPMVPLNQGYNPNGRR